MGSSASKGTSSTLNAAKTASKLSPANTARKYPTRSPPISSPRTNVQEPRPSPIASVRPTVHPATHVSSSRDAAIGLDVSNPILSQAPPNIPPNPQSQSLEKDSSFAARLQQLGPVQPNPTQSNSSIFNISRTSHLSSPNRSSRPSVPPPDRQPPQQTFTPSASTPSQSIFPTPTSNPAVSLLTARYRLAADAEKEFENIGRKGAKGREFLDVTTLRQVLVMRGRGMSDVQIEETLELGKGVVRRLGGRGLVEAAGED